MSFSKPIAFPPSKNSFLVSMNKFHVAKPNRSGYNKIYEIRRSGSFFFDPMGTTSKDLHKSVFISIYTPCSSKELTFNPYIDSHHYCQTPSLFIMSQNSPYKKNIYG